MKRNPDNKYRDKKYYENRDVLNVPGYSIYFTRFADSILKEHFTESYRELEKVLQGFYIPEENILKGGGGLSDISQQLSKLFEAEGWGAKTSKSELFIDGVKVSSQEFEVDHFSPGPNGNVGLKIQWNSKDTLFHSNLEDLRQLYLMNVVSLGVVITRGESLQDELFFLYQRVLGRLPTFDAKTLQDTYNLSEKAKGDAEKKIRAEGRGAIASIAKSMIASKFGQATTHMDKLLPYVDKAMGDPCPLILIGIEKERLTV